MIYMNMMKRLFTTWFICLILGVGLATAQVAKVTGWVVSEEDGEPVVGATVQVKGTMQGTITDMDGKFELKDLPKGAQILQISYVGMQKEEVAIQPTLRIVLKPDVEMLEEVVVTGYGVTRKAAFTGAATTVGSSKIAGKNDANPLKALEGTVPGLQLNISSGQPGAHAEIYVRGHNSINSGTQPLYIIDGVPFNAEEVGCNQSYGVGMSPLATLNSSDIESITVLKDATATSIYGARAANGVIVITTKKGEAGKLQVNFHAKVGFQAMPSYPQNYHKVNAEEYLELTTEALLNGYESLGDNSMFGYYNETLGLGLSNDRQGALDFLDWYTGGWYSAYQERGTATDWVDEVTRTGLMQEYSLDISGGDTNGKSPVYFLSMGYMDEKGIMVGKDLKRYTFRYNMEHNPSKRLKYGFNASLSYTEINSGVEGGYFSDPHSMARFMNPLTPVRTPDGEWNFDTSYAGYNPVAMRSANGDKDRGKNYRAILTPFLQWNVTDQLFWQTRLGVDYMMLDELHYDSFLNPAGLEQQGMGSNSNTGHTQLTITNTLNYLQTFGREHHVNFLLGQEGQRMHIKEAYMEASNYPEETLNGLANAAIPQRAETYESALVLASFFSNAQYDYADKYYASASLRYDASSRFGSNHRWAPFWSVGAKYRLSAESFMEPAAHWLTNLTLRASYGTSGNQEVGKSWYASRDLFEYGSNYNGLPGMSHMQFGNPDLKWEQTGKFNVGIDLSLFNRIHVVLDYYNHLTKDMVFAVPLSMTTGLNKYYQNIGKLSNKGVEASIHAQLLKNKDWNWDASLTWSHNRNRVERLNSDKPIYGSSVLMTEVGAPVYQYLMPEYAGVDPQTGESLWYKGTEGTETTNQYHQAGKRYLGSPLPDFSGSLNTTLRWKNVDFSVQLNYAVGSKIYGYDLIYEEQGGGSMLESYTYYVYDNRWQKPGDITDVPRMNSESGFETSLSSRYLMDGDYLKIRSMTLGYTLPKAWLRKAGIQQGRIFVNAENIHTFCADNYRGYDPSGIQSYGSQSWNYPLPRTVMFGLTLGF